MRHLAVVSMVVSLAAAMGASCQSPSPDSVEQAGMDYAAAVARAREQYNAAVTKAHEGHKKRLTELLAADAKAGRVNPALIDELKKRETDGPPVLADDDLNPKDRRRARYVGVWLIRYSPEITRTYAIKNNGEVVFLEERKTAKLDPKAFTLNFGDGKVERLTFVGDRVFVEHHVEIKDLDRKHPDHVGVGTRKY